MDFLHSIPEELWRAIFVMIPIPWIYGADLSSDPLQLFRSHQMDPERIKNTQSQRLELMLVCKAMWPLAEELLYSEVYFPNPITVSKFSKAARLSRGGRASPGWWTRRVSIDTRGWVLSTVARTLEMIKQTCPNITCVHIEQGSWGIQKAIPKGSSLLRDLRTLTVTGVSLRAEDLTEIENNCPHLIYLHLYPSTALYGRLQSMTFPNLRRLSISSHLVQEMVDTKIGISFPLEWLSIRITRANVIPALHKFCHQHRSNLVGLELYVDVGASTSRPVILPSDFLDFGVNLRTVIISPSIALESSKAITPMEGLNEVILRVDVYHSMFSALAFAEYFAPSRFPHLRRILLVLKTFSLYDGPAICDSLRKLIHDVPVEMRPDYT
jgi:hypothetical protein